MLVKYEGDHTKFSVTGQISLFRHQYLIHAEIIEFYFPCDGNNKT